MFHVILGGPKEFIVSFVPADRAGLNSSDGANVGVPFIGGLFCDQLGDPVPALLLAADLGRGMVNLARKAEAKPDRDGVIELDMVGDFGIGGEAA
jgi:hypothetical protein